MIIRGLYLFDWLGSPEPRILIRRKKVPRFLCPYAKGRDKAGKACKIQIVFGTWAEIKTSKINQTDEPMGYNRRNKK